jgi:hypothetical protein
MSLTIGCIGKGMLVVSGVLSAAANCPGGGPGVFGGSYWAHLQVRAGQRITLHVAAEAKTTWDIRVDGLPRQCRHDVCTMVAKTSPAADRG